MENIDFKNIWQSQDQKTQENIIVHEAAALKLSKEKVKSQIGKLYRPKWTAVLLGIPYSILLTVVAVIAFIAKAYLVAAGVGAIALLMVALLLNYFHQIYLIAKIRKSDTILSVQNQLSQLRVSSYKGLNYAVFQLPFWTLCWVSLDAVKASPLVYGGVNALVFFGFAIASLWLYRKLNGTDKDSWVKSFFISGAEWEPISKSIKIIEQVKEYKTI